MNVTLKGPASVDRRAGSASALGLTLAALLGLAAAAVAAATETHASLQAVKPDGTSAWAGTLPFTVQGILLNDPGEVLDSTPQFVPWNDGAGAGQIGGEWQVFIQAADAADQGGTACWLAQNYGNLGWIKDSAKSYPDAEWTAEVNRLARDPVNNHRFRKGDLVEITVNRSLFYGGKRNLNEAHERTPEADFSIALVRADHGLPTPAVVTLAELVRPDDGDPGTKEDLFDATRATGGERFQGTRVRLNGLTLTDASGWGKTAWAERKCVVTDGAGRFFTVRTALGGVGAAPAGRFDAVGILNQESGSGSDGTFGYELFVQEVIDHAAPALQISVVSWPASAPNFELQFTDGLGNGAWQPLNREPVLGGGRFTVPDPVTATGSRLYRLVQSR
jgi:hypothetical protein